MYWAAKIVTLGWGVEGIPGESSLQFLLADDGITATSTSPRKRRRGWATKIYETGHCGSFLASASFGSGGVDLENNLLSSLIGRQLVQLEL